MWCIELTENSLLHLPIRFVDDTEGRVVALEVSLIPDIPDQRFVRQ